MTAGTESVASVPQERVRAGLRDKRPDRRLRRTAEQLATPPSVSAHGTTERRQHKLYLIVDNACSLC